MTVRDATPADADAIVAIARVAFPLAHTGILAPPLIDAIVAQTYTRDAVRRSIASCAGDPGAHFLVAERDGRVVGYLHYDSAGPRPELHRIYVAPGETGAGYGSSLVHELHRRLPAGTTYVLMVAAANALAVRFYERHGFTAEAEVEGLAYYAEHMGVTFGPDAGAVPSLVLSHTVR